MAYIGRQQDGFGVRSRFIYTATGGQTTFDTDDSSNALSYSDGAYVDVYLNGVLLDPSDYTATSLTSIVLDAGAAADDVLEVIVYDVFSVFSGTFTNGITASEATVTGDLTVDTNTLYVDSTNNRVGVGTSSPSSKTSIIGTGVNGLHLGQQTDNTANSSRLFYDNSTNIWTTYSTAGAFKIASGATIGTSSGSDRLVIDSSGNVGIGTSSPNGTLTVRNGSTNTEQLILGNSTNTGGRDWRIGRDNVATGDLIIKSSDATDSNVTTERMRIDSSGNLLVGKTSNDFATSGFVANANGIGATRSGGACVQINRTSSDGSIQEFYKDGTIVGNIGSGGGGITFGAGSSGSERMRISATSNALSIGKTTFGTAGQGYTVYGNTAPQCYFNKSQSGAVNGILFYHADSYVGGLNYNNTNTSLATSSDERLKDNIENSDDAGAKIDAMQVRQFDWKSTGEHQEYGFVAQELEPVFAHAVHTDKEGDYKSVDYACFVPMLVKEIQSLRQRIATLENA